VYVSPGMVKGLSLSSPSSSLSLSPFLAGRVSTCMYTHVAMPRTRLYNLAFSLSLCFSLSLTHPPAVPANITEFIQNDTRCATLSHDRLNSSANTF